MTTQPHTEQITIKRKWYSSRPEITVAITCEPNDSAGVKLGLAIKVAFGSDADLSGAVLRDADLRDADLSGAVLRDADLRDAVLSDADLSGAVLRDADLRGADLRGADLRDAVLSDAVLRDADLSGAVLRPIKADLWMILAMARHKVPALISALRRGKVNGSTYEGECACLVGTLEHAGAANLQREASSAAELWFAPIRPGDLPAGNSEGSFRARTALEWALEFCAVSGIDPDGAPAVQAEAA